MRDHPHAVYDRSRHSETRKVPMTTLRAHIASWMSLASIILHVVPLRAFAQAPAEAAPVDGPAVIERTIERATGDLDEMRKRGRVRVLVSFSRTNFFVSHGQPRGFDYDLLSEYQADLQKRFGDGKRAMTVVFVPVPFDELIPALIDGRGDIAAGGLTIDRKSV